MSRSGHGFNGLKRKFKIMNYNTSWSLEINELRKSFLDFHVEIEEKEIDSLFKAFDTDGCF
jgi:Ca2+-binding EF-hand superfamily protein